MMRRRKGSALIYALVLMLVLSLAATAGWRATILRTTDFIQGARETEVRLLAEAGLEHARALLADDRELPEPLEATLGRGFYRVVAEAGDDGIELTSTGEIRDAGVVLHAFTLRVNLPVLGGAS